MGIWAKDAQGNRVKVAGLGLSGKESSVNGMSTVTIKAGENVKVETDAEAKTITISATGGSSSPTVVSVPEQNGSLTYNGTEQSPVWSVSDWTAIERSGDLSGTNAGDYMSEFTPTAGYVWPDGTTDTKTVTWRILKAANSITLDKTSLSLTTEAPSDTITVTRLGTGAVSATSSDPETVNVSVNGNMVSVTANKSGNATITIAVAADTNYTASSSQSCIVRTTIVSNRIFGVCWDYSNASPDLQRLTVANDPQQLVNTDITTEPISAVGNDLGSSPFDNFYPWNKMDEWNVVDGMVTVKRGQPGFSRTANDVVVFIPEFCFKVVDDATNKKRYYYISQKDTSDFTKHPGSGRCVGKYNTGDEYVSKSGLAPLISISRATARTGHKGRGAKFNNYDFATLCAIQLLYLVEFASWDSQSKVGRGYVDNSSGAINSGGCDSMNYHTGRPAGTDGKTAVMYRWIENIWGNVYDWIDGINISERRCYICTSPDNFADDTATNYTNSGVTHAAEGWIKGYGYSSVYPWALIPRLIGGSETTYVCDYVIASTGWRGLVTGGAWLNTGYAGLFCFTGTAALHMGSSYGARQLYIPTNEEIQKMLAA